MIKKGDTIKCQDVAEAIEKMKLLRREGIDTDMIYKKDGQQGIWLWVLTVT